MISVGDLHIKENEPYWRGMQQLLLYWLNEWQKRKEPLVFLGDIYDTSSPNWECVKIFQDFLVQWEHPVYIIHGNHEMSYQKKSALLGLMALPNVRVFFEPEEFELEGKRCFAMPFLYQKERRQAYNEMTGTYDYIFTHLTHKKYSFGGEFNEFKMKGTHIHGHIHVTDDFQEEGNRYILAGVPQTTRNGEQEFDKRAVLLGTSGVTFEELPKFMDIIDLPFGKFPENPNYLINIHSAPSLAAVGEMYKGYFYRKNGVDVLRTDAEAASVDTSKISKTIEEEFSEWAKEKKYSAEVIKCGTSFLQRV